MCAEKLALYGGEKLKSTPFGAGNRFGENDLHHLKEALEGRGFVRKSSPFGFCNQPE